MGRLLLLNRCGEQIQESVIPVVQVGELFSIYCPHIAGRLRNAPPDRMAPLSVTGQAKAVSGVQDKYG